MHVNQQLISACISGDRKSQNELYKICYPYLISICLRYTRNSDRAKETLNLGFFRILKYLNTYKLEEPFEPWISRVMITTLIKEYKKEKAHNLNLVYVEDYHDSERYSEMSHIITRINSEQLYRFISLLPSASQQVFNLYIVDGYKHHEIAVMLEISEGTSKWHLNSAREKLKEMILTWERNENLNKLKMIKGHE